jgi:hypothetical protein
VCDWEVFGIHGIRKHDRDVFVDGLSGSVPQIDDELLQFSVASGRVRFSRLALSGIAKTFLLQLLDSCRLNTRVVTACFLTSFEGLPASGFPFDKRPLVCPPGGCEGLGMFSSAKQASYFPVKKWPRTIAGGEPCARRM